MDDHRREMNYSTCYFHPEEVFVGICPLCLNERLVILAAKQGGYGQHNSTRKAQSGVHRKTSIGLPKIFALGSFLNRLEFKHWKSDSFSYGDNDNASTSPEDSFISIKFGDNGAASWEKTNTVSKVSLENCDISWKNHGPTKVSRETNPTNTTTTNTTKSVIEHPKPRAASLRWRRRIGHLFHLMRWKKSSKGNVCHVGGKVEGVKVRNGWIRTLTKRRTKE